MVFVRRKRAGRKAAKRAARKSSKSLKTMVTKIAKQAALAPLETKFVTGGGISNIAFNSGISSSTLEFYSLIPPIVRGNGSWQLLDNSLVPLSITTTWHIGLANVARSQNLVVDLYLLENRNIKTFPALAGSSVRFLRTGQNTETQNYNGFIQDSSQPIQLNDFKLLKHYKFQLASNVGLANADTTSGNAPNLSGGLSYKRITYTYKNTARHKLMYTPDGATGNIYPNNTAPFWCLGYSKVDGSAPDVTQQNVLVTTTCRMFYKDA